MKSKFHPVLAQDSSIKLEDGSIWVVERVTSSSATVKCIGSSKNYKTGERMTISSRAAVERV